MWWGTDTSLGCSLLFMDVEITPSLQCLKMSEFWENNRKAKGIKRKRRKDQADRLKGYSRYCGFKDCRQDLCEDSQAKCVHPSSNYGNRLKGMPNQDRTLPHRIWRDEVPSEISICMPETSKYSSARKRVVELQRAKSIETMEMIECKKLKCPICSENNIHNHLQALHYLQSLKAPYKGDKHLQFSKEMVRLVSHFPFSPLWRPFLAIRVMDILAAAYPYEENVINGWHVSHSNISPGLVMSWTYGREVRDAAVASSPTLLGRSFLRVIDPKSKLALSLITQLHDEFHEFSDYAVQNKLDQLKIRMNHLPELLKRVKEECRSIGNCKKKEIGRAHTRRLSKRREAGPIDIGTISQMSNVAPGSFWVSDTVGPIPVTCSCSGGTIQRHIIIFVQIFIGRCILMMLPNLSIDATYKALVKLSGSEGKITLLVVDPSSAFRAIATDLGPIEVNGDESLPEILTELSKRRGVREWHRILYSRFVNRQTNNSIQVKVSPTNASRQQTKAEGMVAKIKLWFSNMDMFGNHAKASLEDVEFDSQLMIIQCIINNIPSLRLSDTCFFSPNDYLQASGRIILNENFPNIFENGNHSSQKLLKSIKDVSTLATVMKNSLFSFFLPLMQCRSVKAAKEGRSGAPIERIKRGAVVVDFLSMKTTHSLRKSLARVELVGKGRRWALISRVIPKNNGASQLRKELYSCSSHERRGCTKCISKIVKNNRNAFELVTRRTDELYLIWAPDTEDTDNTEIHDDWEIPSLWREGANNYDFGSYLIPVDPELLSQGKNLLKEIEDK